MWANAIMWISASVATSIGLFITENANCLWALLIPTFVSYNSGSKNKEENEKY